MSTFSIVGLALLAVIVVVGTILKIVFWRQRKKLDGCNGYVRNGETEKCKTDDWKLC
ncbi:MAG: hypothetical protein LBI03_10810 [Clostridiales bacterium]|jgi:hypothetical protein|nr:hypothetical protein [Clostridiales bacterium]